MEALGLEPRPDSLQKSRSTIKLHPHVVLTDYDYVNEDISLYLPPNLTKDLGAGGRNRTPYLVVTKHLLCLLSYTGTGTASGNRTRVPTVKKSYPTVRRKPLGGGPRGRTSICGAKTRRLSVRPNPYGGKGGIRTHDLKQ